LSSPACRCRLAGIPGPEEASVLTGPRRVLAESRQLDCAREVGSAGSFRRSSIVPNARPAASSTPGRFTCAVLSPFHRP
jgi:hypothetical protein